MKKVSLYRGLTLATLCALLCGSALAEVTTEPLPRHRVRTLLMDRLYTGITDGADPIPSISWQTYRNLPAGRQLNKSGASRPDGRPDIAFRPPFDAPLVVWAYNNGAEHDIAFAAWEHDQWGPVRFLTASASLNEIDPRIFYGPGGVIHVVWTVQPLNSALDSMILLVSRTPGVLNEDGTVATEAAWSSPRRISLPGEPVGRPTVAESHGFVWVAYERYANADAGAGTQVVVRRRPADENGGAWSEAGLFTSNRFGSLDPLLTSMHGRLWLDWHHGADHFAYTQLQSVDLTWAPLHGVPLSNPSWQGVEDVRQSIRRLVIERNAPTVLADPGDAADTQQ